MSANTKTTWRTVRLGEVSKNFDSKRKPLSSMVRANMQGDYPYYGAAEIVDHINEYIFEGEYLLVAEDGTVTTSEGHPVLQLVEGKFWVNNHAHIIKGEDDEDTRYLFYALSNIGVNPYITGAVQLKITQQNLNSIEILYPDKNDRKRLAAVLSAFDDKIENNNRIIKTLEEIAQAIFKEWFVDFRFPGYEKAKFVDSELGRIPKGWEVKSLFGALSVTYGYPLKSSLFNEEGHGIPVIRIRNILESKTSTSTTEGVADKKYIAEDGDILVGMDGIFHLQIWTAGQALLNQRVVRFRPKDNKGWFFLYLALQMPIKQKTSSAVGTTVAHLSDKDLKSIDLLVPDQNMKDKFDEFADENYNQIVMLQKENRKLAAMRDLLLPKLISGEIRI